MLAYAFGVLLLPVQQELGWSRTALTGAYALAISISGVAAIPVGRWLDRHGARALMTIGAAAASLLVLAWAQVSDLTVFYGIWLGIGLTMAAVLYEPAFAVIATWYRDAAERTGALLGLTVVAGLASVIYVPLAGWLVQTLGWRRALLVLAVLLAVLTVLPNATLPGRRPDHLERPGHDESTRPVAVEHPADVALRRALGATWTGLLGAGSVGGRILVTVLGRRWPLATTTGAIFAVQALTVGILVLTDGPAGVVAFVVLVGLGVGLISLAGPPWSPTSTGWPMDGAGAASTVTRERDGGPALGTVPARARPPPRT